MALGQVVFLGIARRAGPSPDRLTTPINIESLRPVVLCHLFPFVPAGWSLVVGIKIGARISGRVEVETEGGRWLTARVDVASSGMENAVEALGWTVLPIPLDGDPVTYAVPSPRDSFVSFRHDSGEVEYLGGLVFAYQRAPELTPELVRALRASPGAVKVAQIRINDRHGGVHLNAHCALDRADVDPSTLPVGSLWYRDLPDELHVETPDGPDTIDLRYIRESAHWLLIDPYYRPPGSHVDLLYSPAHLFGTVDRFVELIDTEPREEAVQQMLTSEPLLLTPFAPMRIYTKPKLLTDYVADFGILNARGELLLIEIERPSMTLFRKDNQSTEPLTHAISQVESSLALFQRHRASVLHCIDSSLPDVRAVRGYVIAGRSQGADKGLDQIYARGGNVEVMTYDHLADAVRNIIRETVRQSTGIK